jgi:hypothetical protein
MIFWVAEGGQWYYNPALPACQIPENSGKATLVASWSVRKGPGGGLGA